MMMLNQGLSRLMSFVRNPRDSSPDDLMRGALASLGFARSLSRVHGDFCHAAFAQNLPSKTTLFPEVWKDDTEAARLVGWYGLGDNVFVGALTVAPVGCLISPRVLGAFTFVDINKRHVKDVSFSLSRFLDPAP